MENDKDVALLGTAASGSSVNKSTPNELAFVAAAKASGLELERLYELCRQAVAEDCAIYDGGQGVWFCDNHRRAFRAPGIPSDCHTESLDDTLALEGWRGVIAKAATDARLAEMAAQYLYESDSARNELRKKGYGCSGMPWKQTVDMVPPARFIDVAADMIDAKLKEYGIAIPADREMTEAETDAAAEKLADAVERR
jgi:hypothetical protein